MRGIIVAGIILILVIVGVVILNRRTGNPILGSITGSPQSTVLGQSTTSPRIIEFSNSKESENFKKSTPEHGTILTNIPEEIVIEFNSKLSENSEIKVIKAGRDFGKEKATIYPDGYSMRIKMEEDSPGDIYTVIYNACWLDRTCHTGNFQFAFGNSKTPEPKDD